MKVHKPDRDNKQKPRCMKRFSNNAQAQNYVISENFDEYPEKMKCKKCKNKR